MEDSARVLSRAAGPLNSDVMFIGEAPGRLGADTFEIPFHGDKSGHNFEELLAFAGLNRSQIFVTNGVLCNPKAETGNNATPSKSEVANCSGYLKEQLDLLQPKVVVTLGAVALEALKLVSPHDFSLSTHVRTKNPWFGRFLLPLYHPGARAMVHRSMANQRSDYQFVAEEIRRLTQAKRRPSGKSSQSVSTIAEAIIRRRGQVSYFGLHKLFFLVECEAASKLGHQLSTAFFLRQKDGPYCTDLHLAKLQKAIPSLVVTSSSDRLMLSVKGGDLFAESTNALADDAIDVMERVIANAGTLSDSELKTRVYLSKPMRKILRMERSHLVNLYNSPIVL